MKRTYEKLYMSQLEIAPKWTILAGSLTGRTIKIADEVTVQKYDYGFSSDGGNTDAGIDINFD